MCSYEGYFLNIDCVLHKCTNCSLDDLKQKLLDSNASKLTDQHKGFLVKEWVSKTKEYNGAMQSYLH